ncbi:hypothetical protein XMIN_291 [Xanthomonas citri pv. mangiferaeindicae LMG 941]|nr:hypothetical protein XMIN_291 [Xanthomonas citri pv. mangiferaeindicae LMG 941]
MALAFHQRTRARATSCSTHLCWRAVRWHAVRARSSVDASGSWAVPARRDR